MIILFLINMETYNWNHINNLARQYHSLVRKGYGITEKDRCPEQIEIINDIITRTIPFLISIAEELVHGNGSNITNKNKKYTSP